MVLENVCPPALLYLAFSIVQIIIDLFRGDNLQAFFKFIVMIIFTIVLNAICNAGMSVISWFIVFIPFILMTYITTILFFIFGVNPAGKMNKCDVSQFGCCPDGKTMKTDPSGRNCYFIPPLFVRDYHEYPYYPYYKPNYPPIQPTNTESDSDTDSNSDSDTDNKQIKKKRNNKTKCNSSTYGCCPGSTIASSFDGSNCPVTSVITKNISNNAGNFIPVSNANDVIPGND